jgi:hypothetical protein
MSRPRTKAVYVCELKRRKPLAIVLTRPTFWVVGMRSAYNPWALEEAEEKVSEAIKAGRVKRGFLARQEQAKAEVKRHLWNWRDYRDMLDRLSALAREYGHKS